MKQRIGIAIDERGWHERYAEGARTLDLPFELFDIRDSDWINRVKRYACVVWRVSTDIPWLEQGFEKIYFMNAHLGIRTFPNWSTFATYDNKRAQAYLFSEQNVPTPRTLVSYDRRECEAFLESATFPFVSKTAGGSASRGVRLIRNRRSAQKQIGQVFGDSLTERVLRRLGRQYPRRVDTPRGYVYWQEFIRNNERDCRITVLGKRYVFILYRRNRSGDFRASGSGMLEYEGPAGQREARFLVELCRRNDYDCMAFDLLFRGEDFVVSEMSCTFPMTFLDAVPQYYDCVEDRTNVIRADRVWAQTLFMRYVGNWFTMKGERESGVRI